MISRTFGGDAMNEHNGMPGARASSMPESSAVNLAAALPRAIQFLAQKPLPADIVRYLTLSIGWPEMAIADIGRHLTHKHDAQHAWIVQVFGVSGVGVASVGTCHPVRTAPNRIIRTTATPTKNGTHPPKLWVRRNAMEPATAARA